jgi:hypothetical protein
MIRVDPMIPGTKKVRIGDLEENELTKLNPL